MGLSCNIEFVLNGFSSQFPSKLNRSGPEFKLSPMAGGDAAGDPNRPPSATAVGGGFLPRGRERKSWKVKPPLKAAAAVMESLMEGRSWREARLMSFQTSSMVVVVVVGWVWRAKGENGEGDKDGDDEFRVMITMLRMGFWWNWCSLSSRLLHLVLTTMKRRRRRRRRRRRTRERERERERGIGQ
ncbi:hypothetical protein HYC85_002109 [Camellia sinensis]|uniref:Uncharacterized protein n=1 Tax=Camellia sinensis TaxID=4442 RepID=A0A7J7I799_CAMSI|nr:hypothetical protein HYC85_002109 [Camellia sinensis]